MFMHIIVSNSSRDPIYEQIAQQIRTHIVNGSLEPGELLPSIRTLARELQVSVITTKRAYDDLEQEGFIDSVAGKGSFVSAQNSEFLKERQVRAIEELLGKAITMARRFGLDKEIINQMVELLFEHEE